MIWLMVVAVWGSLAVLLWQVNRALTASIRLYSTIEREPDGSLRVELRELREDVDRLPAKWDEVEASIMRKENRIRATVRRAREELENRGFEDPGLEAEAAELRLVDGGGGPPGGMQPVRGGVAPGPGSPARPLTPEEVEAADLEDAIRRKWSS
jgi:hypothetical protein